jgi:hypothetical protein
MDGRTDIQTDMTKIIAAFRSLAITHNNSENNLTHLFCYKTINFVLKNSRIFVTYLILIRIIINPLCSIAFLFYINNLWNVA